MSQDWKNKLYFGDNLPILREYISDNSIDLIYLDPPFNSKATYNVLFAEKNGSESSAQITAFEDTWKWGQESRDTYEELVQHASKLSDLIEALMGFLGSNDMMAYLVMMASRLSELHRVLKPTGSIYLHCDPTASHYLKIIMDSIFGVTNFRNEITWKRTTAHSDSGRFGANSDTILFYSKSTNYVFNPIYQPYDAEYEARFRNADPDGRKWADYDLTAKGLSGGGYEYEYKGVTSLWRCPIETMKRYDQEGRLHFTSRGGIRFKRYLNDLPGLPCQAVWSDINPINSQAKERLGYPTQKPEALLERIINASSNEGDLVLDPFCGCGTTIAVAERLKRRWIGIDITYLAISLMKTRLQDTFEKDLAPYEVIGDPKDLWGAKALAEENRFQFEWWAIGKVGAYPAQDKKKGADSGIDGIIKFFDDNSKKPKKIIIQVKSGKVQVSQIRDLIHVVKREKAVIGAFITLNPPTKPMETEALNEGYYVPEYLGKEHKYPVIQILTVKQILTGEGTIKYPRLADATFKKAQRKDKGKQEEQNPLPF